MLFPTVVFTKDLRVYFTVGIKKNFKTSYQIKGNFAKYSNLLYWQIHCNIVTD